MADITYNNCADGSCTCCDIYCGRSLLYTTRNEVNSVLNLKPKIGRPKINKSKTKAAKKARRSNRK